MLETSELFLTFVRRLIVWFAILLLLGFAAAVSHAQNAGNVGIYTREVPVFVNQAVTTTSGIFPDFGFGCNFLSYQTNGFVGMIDVHWIPPGTTTPIILQQASYPSASPDTASHILQVGGYFPNMYSTVTRINGSLSAQYTAQAAPCPYVSSGLGSNGPSSPVNCDLNANYAVASGAGQSLLASPVNPGDSIIICAFSISFQGATSAGGVNIGWATSTACSSFPSNGGWTIYTTAATPQTLVFPFELRGTSAFPFPCMNNTSGSQLAVSISYASVHGL